MNRSLLRKLTSGTMAAILTGMAHADTVTTQVTVDNVYSLYVGTASGLTLLGTNNDWVAAETYSFSATAGDYVYIAAWDWGGVQGMQGIVVGTNGTFRSNGSDFVYASVPASALTPWSSNTSTAPPITSLQIALQSATWLPVVGVGTRTQWPWGAHITDPGALWIWGDTLTDPSITDGQLVVFRTISPVVASVVPEPGVPALLLSGLLLLTFRLRLPTRCWRQTSHLIRDDHQYP